MQFSTYGSHMAMHNAVLPGIKCRGKLCTREAVLLVIFTQAVGYHSVMIECTSITLIVSS